ncbi:bifunctional serine/threonine-protein kinase/ABC transporter substrate-binding protein [Streptomyces sp. NPDC002054]|uniref:bifunctional serine/threonine-protein kinase/ABC transporter substrate-binding protein n=1 Tax=Streptomyces sp. NPDC002054 TaxID=3154663 RepID=UPI0033349142
MRALTPADPSTVGGHRLLGRLGSGGMGTVYLGRSPAGTLLAVKVIRADHAADPAFRARFRREAEAAGRLSGRWVVPVVAADPDAREPWLATPFVPGPSLSEAVGAYGPLPAGTVRTLGARLAEALAEVHAAGLVHRDVKPGNILLALDGPRLIDFGIAREAGAPTLTAVDAVIGTPGYLAPEQARTGGPEPSPASDVFSLGCVLVYAATGRGPFGGGHPAAVVFRTVHDDPDLNDLPEPLRPAVTACLSKTPASRPTPFALTTLLTPATDAGVRLSGSAGVSAAAAGRERVGDGRAAAGPVGSPERADADAVTRDAGTGTRPDGGSGSTEPAGAGQGADAETVTRYRGGQADRSGAAAPEDAPDPGTAAEGAAAARSGIGEPGTGEVGGDWLPGGLRRLIAERSTRALDLPAPEPTRIDPPAAEAATPRSLTRRRFLVAGGALLAVGAAAPAVWLGTRGRGSGTATPPPPDRPTLTLALQADLTGPGKATGQAHERGMQLAVAQHNARPDAPFRLALRVVDDRGDATRAEQAVKELAADPAVIGLVGPTWPAAVVGLAAACHAADLPLLTVSVDTPERPMADTRTLCTTRPDDSQLSLTVIHYLSTVRPSRRIAVVEQQEDGDTAWQLVRSLSQTPPEGAEVTGHRVPRGAAFGPAVRELTAQRAEAVVFAGTSPQRAAELARTLADAGFTGPRVGVQHIMEPAFLTAAGPAAEGWVIGSFFTDPLAVPAAAAFVSAYRAAYGEPPARWATEAYDAVGFQAAALTGLEGEGRDRAGLARRIFRTPYQGLAKPLEFDVNTHALTWKRTAHLYRVASGGYRYLGIYTDVRTDP